MHTFITAYRLAEHDLNVEAHIDHIAWPGTRYVRQMFSCVPFPISLRTACTLARDNAEIRSVWYWHTKEKEADNAQRQSTR